MERINKLHGVVYTPSNVAQLMNTFLNRRGSLLDPCVGTGNLLHDIELYDVVHVYDIDRTAMSSITYPNVVKHCEDFTVARVDFKYDNIILNPPYIRIQDIPSDKRAYIKQEFPLLAGNFDLFHVFLLKCLHLLTDEGVMVSIHPNSILYNKSSVSLIEYMIHKRLIRRIIDYGSEKIFQGVSVYCCIMVFDRLPHEKPLYDEPCWKPIFKVSKNTTRYIIYPYDEHGKVVDEEVFKTTNPCTYNYMSVHRSKLDNRDKGKKTYESWYAFGRRQGILNPLSYGCDVVYIPTMSSVDIRIYKKEYMLFYSGLCISGMTNEYVDTVIDTITHNSTRLSTRCSKRGNGWINITSGVIKDLFSVDLV